MVATTKTPAQIIQADDASYPPEKADVQLFLQQLLGGTNSAESGVASIMSLLNALQDDVDAVTGDDPQRLLISSAGTYFIDANWSMDRGFIFAFANGEMLLDFSNINIYKPYLVVVKENAAALCKLYAGEGIAWDGSGAGHGANSIRTLYLRGGESVMVFKPAGNILSAVALASNLEIISQTSGASPPVTTILYEQENGRYDMTMRVNIGSSTSVEADAVVTGRTIDLTNAYLVGISATVNAGSGADGPHMMQKAYGGNLNRVQVYNPRAATVTVTLNFKEVEVAY